VFGFERVQQVDEVVVFDREEDVLFILQHLHLLGSGDRILPDELQRAVLVVQPATTQKHLRETPAPQELDDIEVAKLQRLVAHRFPQQRRGDADFPDSFINKSLHRGISFTVDNLRKVVVEGHSFKPNAPVEGGLAFLYKLQQRFFEVGGETGEGVRVREVFSNGPAVGQQQIHLEQILPKVIVLSRLKFLPHLQRLPRLITADHLQFLSIEGFLVGR
jgi:hypothetical protein